MADDAVGAVLVHLDSSHLSWVQTARASDRASLRRFRAAWQDAKADLCLSTHHVAEIAQLSDGESMRKRFAVIARFPGVRLGPDCHELCRREVAQQLIASATGGRPANCRVTAREMVFRPLPISPIEAAAFKNLAEFKKLHGLNDVSAGLDNYWKLRAELGLRPKSNETRRDVLKKLGIAPSVRAAKGVPTEDLALIAIFAQLARQAAEPLRGTHGLIDADVDAVDPWRCPGFRLWFAAERARRRAPKRAEASDVVDAWHVAMAAYADLAFIDKRTLEFLTQEARAKRSGLSMDAITHFRHASKLDDITKELRRMADLLSTRDDLNS